MTSAATARADTPSDAPASRLGPVHAWWATLAPREQALTLVGAIAVGIALVWLVALRPALTTLRQTPAQLDTLDAQLQSMQRMAAEARELRASPSIPPAQATAALQAASARLGDRAKLVIQADRAVLSVTGIDNESLRNWLAEVRSGARARPTEAQLTRTPQGFTGTVTLTIVGAP